LILKALGLCLDKNLNFVEIDSGLTVEIRIPIVITNDQDYYSTDKGKALNKAWSSHLERFRKLYPTALVIKFKKDK
jgi:hypothetical protein